MIATLVLWALVALLWIVKVLVSIIVLWVLAIVILGALNLSIRILWWFFMLVAS